MAVTNITRNLRDGQLTVSDGAAASVVLTLDNGDLRWSEPSHETIQIRDRGVLHHVRKADEQAVDLSYSAMWVHLIAASVSGSADSDVFYEMINNVGSGYTTVDATHDKFMLQHEFLVSDPVGSNDEKITFDRVYKVNCEVTEGDQSNVISFSGVHYRTAPTVTRP